MDSKTKEFIDNAVKKHGDRYNYDKVKYINNHTKVKIYCKIHDYFDQNPKSHLRGAGCRFCGYILMGNHHRQDLNIFIDKSKQLYGDKFNYDKVEYKNNNTKIIITCTICNIDFIQIPMNHLKTDRLGGCPKCFSINISNKLRNTKEQFIEKAVIKYKNKFCYKEVNYINNYTQVKIKCNTCNTIFKQQPSTHLSKISRGGCPNCNVSKGYSKMQIQWLNHISNKKNIYIQHAENDGEFKVNGPKKLRVDGYCKDTNTVYEFHGCAFHGCKKCFSPIKYNNMIKKTMGDVYQSTIEKENYIKSLGYNLVIMWQCEWKIEWRIINLEISFQVIFKVKEIYQLSLKRINRLLKLYKVNNIFSLAEKFCKYKLTLNDLTQVEYDNYIEKYKIVETNLSNDEQFTIYKKYLFLK